MNRKLKNSLTRERYPFMVGATYRRRDEAKDAAYNLQMQLGLSSDQISIVSPGDKNFEKKIESETGAIGRTLLHTHLNFGLAGAACGFTAAVALSFFGPSAIQASPSLAIIAMTIMGLFFGLLLAGLISLRPDHDPLINTIRHAVEHNSWAIVVRLSNEIEKSSAEAMLRNQSTSSSL